MFTSVYICLLSVWGCCDWYIHLHGGFESGRLDFMNVRVFLEGTTFMHFNAHYFNCERFIKYHCSLYSSHF